MAVYTVTFNANGGTLRSPAKLYYNTATLTWHTDSTAAASSILRQVRIPVKSGSAFGGFFAGTSSAPGVCACTAHGEPLVGVVRGNVTVYALWTNGSSYSRSVVDFFNLGSDALIPIASEDGSNVRRVVTRSYGKTGGMSSDMSASQQSGKKWLYPSVRYMVVGNCMLSFTLGKGYRAPDAYHTGYMLTQATVETRDGEFPIVTLGGTANEGTASSAADAVNTFPVSVPVAARARAQNLMAAATGDVGAMHSAVLSASCDPVVLAEDMIPCASDVCGGKVGVSFEILVDAGAPAPDAADGFSINQRAVSSVPPNYALYRLDVERSL